MTSLLQTPRPAGGFRLIEADPPWPFATRDGQRKVFTSGKAQPYEAMSMADLARLPVRMMAARDAILHMWIVDANLPDALALGQAWGFTYKTRGLTWDKGRMSGGFWVRRESEIALIFTRGQPTRLDAGVRDMIRAKPREHSRKPDERYERLERLAAGPYLELFARTTRPGWTSWGNEVDKFTPAAGAAA